MSQLLKSKRLKLQVTLADDTVTEIMHPEDEAAAESHEPLEEEEEEEAVAAFADVTKAAEHGGILTVFINSHN